MRNFKIILSVVLLMVLTFSTTACIKVKIESSSKPSSSINQLNSATSTSKISSNVDDVSYKSDEKAVTILCVGVDLSERLTDVIIIARADFDNSNVSILQIPRDTFIGVEYPTGKINAVYSNPFKGLSGIDSLEKVIEKKLSLEIDYNFMISLDNFRNIIDQIGGIPINVPSKINFLPGKVIEAGEQVLNGEQSEWFVRFRKGYDMGDIDRVGVQKLFLQQAIKTIKEKSLMDIITLATKNYSSIDTNMPINKMLGFAGSIYTIPLSDVKFFLLEGQPKKYLEYAVFEPYFSNLALILNENFRDKDKLVDRWDLSLSSVPEPTIEIVSSQPEHSGLEQQSSLSNPVDFGNVLDRLYEIYNKK